MTAAAFSAARFRAVLVKEFIQMFRDRLTFALMVGVPIMQLVLFGYAINSDPRHLPTALVVADDSLFTRSIVGALLNTDYFRIVARPRDPAAADALIARGAVQFAIEIPVDFGRSLERGDRPSLLIEADATDPVAVENALGAIRPLIDTALAHDLVGPLQRLSAPAAPFDIRLQRRYNPEGATEFNIVPGLMGTILTMTLAMMTGAAVTREFERGTMENLLATPARPLEVMLAKIIPYVLVGFAQVCVILVAGAGLFHVPMEGGLGALLACAFVFIAANLAVGFTFSTLARNQMQALQMSIFFFLPSMLLSGFLFPFRGMPSWAQAIGEVLPLTHFLRIVRGIMLKGNGWPEIWPQLWPLLLFLLVVSTVALRRYRQTLD